MIFLGPRFCPRSSKPLPASSAVRGPRGSDSAVYALLERHEKVRVTASPPRQKSLGALRTKKYPIIAFRAWNRARSHRFPHCPTTPGLGVIQTRRAHILGGWMRFTPDFPRILGKSGVNLIHPPKMCARLVWITPRPGVVGQCGNRCDLARFQARNAIIGYFLVRSAPRDFCRGGLAVTLTFSCRSSRAYTALSEPRGPRTAELAGSGLDERGQNRGPKKITGRHIG